ncbi:MAG: PSD1 and planctomycete cytochrome C domain-containing protein [Pirellulaceae bacterium]|nr:PSD1 and planctomycete cytochrome C domain-containing protein [Pirellulaceae bacterium]
MKSRRICLRIAAIGWIYVVSFSSTLSFSAEHLFNRDIRPILAENCFYCHGQDSQKRESDLRLDDREAAIESGAIVPNKADSSELIRRILSDDPDERMPPPNSNRQLSNQQKQRLKQWIEDGAAYAPHWAFVTPTQPKEPSVTLTTWPRAPIDAFVLAKLEIAKLSPSPEADRTTLIKRLSIDLLGLSPTPEEVEQFVSDEDPKAYDKLVDRYLDSKHYGERMALEWLDAARYADSNGFQQDGDTWQWIWRDWVVRALNNDLPFDLFTIWQLAGDLLPDATEDQKIASGFNRNHLLNGEGGAIAEEQRFVNLFDRMDTTATNWLGLTMACAQCHDHKYDPITQRDYYSLMDAFNRVPESGKPSRFSSKVRVAEPLLELPTEAVKKEIATRQAEVSKVEKEAKAVKGAAFEGWYAGLMADGKLGEGKGLPNNVAVILSKPEAERSAKEIKALAKELRQHYNVRIQPTLVDKIPLLKKSEQLTKKLAEYKGDFLPRVMIMSDDNPRETSILGRGDYLSPTEKVAFATPAFLPPLPESAPPNRLGFAQWLVATENPLTARVQVNRMWQHFFGTGIVKTSEDFGVQSEYPTHNGLLDWLAVEFQNQKWSMKSMHRLIVSSATYRQSSRVSEELRRRDPENRLFSRSSRIRMPAMILRDWALGSSGLLNGQLGGKPVYPYQPDEIWESLAITKERDFSYPASHGDDLYRRSLYTFWRRTVGPANMFDAANRQTCRVRLATTSTPLHALTMLNDPTWVEASRALAERVLSEHSNLEDQLTNAFRRIVMRRPNDKDLSVLRRMYESQSEIYQADPESAADLLAVGESTRDETLDPQAHAAMTMVCLAIYNLDEALTRE